jgi:FkbH-like protein
MESEGDRQERVPLDERKKMHKVKCLVWDLDNTLWIGSLLEDEEVALRDGVADVIRTLDERGILLSIASRNDYQQAMNKLEKFGLHEYFIYPQINWGSKSTSLEKISKSLNIGIDTLAFIDDQAFEREEVAHFHPEILCLDLEDISALLTLPVMLPRFVTDDSRHRRKLYQSDMARRQAEENFEGAQDEFLATLNMHLTISPAEETDLKRAEELTVRTNQLNTTGRTYSYDELSYFRTSDKHLLWMASLEDKYGTYGKIGLTLIEKDNDTWWIRLLLMSCRVMSRGVGGVMINHIRNQAREAGVRLMAEVVPNDRNRMMYMTYKFNHFRETEQSDDLVIFENDLSIRQAFPKYLKLTLQ